MLFGASKDDNFVAVKSVLHTIIRCREPANFSLFAAISERNFRLMHVNTNLLHYCKDSIIYKLVKDPLVFCLTH